MVSVESGLSKPAWGSVGMAWLRLLLFVVAVPFGFLAFAALLAGAEPARGALYALATSACVAALLASYRMVRASGESLRKLARDPNVPAALVQQAQAVLQGRKGASALVR